MAKSKTKHQHVIFTKPQDVGARNWGKEELLVLVSKKFMLKKLSINSGSKGGLQYHRKKNECGILISGKLLVRYDRGDGVLNEKTLLPGDCFHFPPGVIHQEEAIEDCVIIEASTPHFNDRVRVEEEYGIEAEEGLPSTEMSDILEK